MSWWDRLFSFDHFGELVPLVTGAIAAGAILGVLAGVIGPMIQARDLAFAVHGTSELAFFKRGERLEEAASVEAWEDDDEWEWEIAIAAARQAA